MVSRTIKATQSIRFGFAQPTGHAQPTAFNRSLSGLVLSGVEVAEGNNHTETKR